MPGFFAFEPFSPSTSGSSGSVEVSLGVGVRGSGARNTVSSAKAWINSSAAHANKNQPAQRIISLRKGKKRSKTQFTNFSSVINKTNLLETIKHD